MQRFPLNAVANPFVVQRQFILLSPCGFLAQDYVLVPRLASYLGYEEHLYKAHLVVKFFIWSDVVTFLLQAGGGGMSAIQSMANTGKYVCCPSHHSLSLRQLIVYLPAPSSLSSV